jgi:amino acid adenylation domain-containing protein
VIDSGHIARQYPLSPEQKKLMHELFEEQVLRTPDAPAVISDEGSITYEELNRRANRLAHSLRKLGVEPDDRVGLCVEQGLEMMVGLLGVLKAGGAYVPLDPAYPVKRLQYMLEDSEVAVLLTQRQSKELLWNRELGITVLELGDEGSKDCSETNLNARSIGLTSSHLAYVLYTSGSTGMPKGVMVQHGGLCNYVCWAAMEYPTARNGSTVSSSVSFDGTVTSLYVPLLCGGTVHLQGKHNDIERLYNELRSGHCNVLYSITPTYLDVLGHRLLEDGVQTTVGEFIIGGEPLSASTVRAWRQIQPGVRMVNEYGPTETVVGCIWYDVPPNGDVAEPIPIGQPIANTRVHILDSRGNSVPAGATGELYISGAGVARGYLKRPALTAENFVPDPFVPEAGARMYRTGDLARLLPDGNIEFLGRSDFQVKIRGFRIELREIEARLAEHSAIKEVVVVSREDTPGNQRLVAYYTSRGENSLQEGVSNAEALRAHLIRALPEYMIPAAYVRLHSFPLDPNGKLDRNALPIPKMMQPELAPRTETEKALAQACAGVLGISSISMNSTFIELGGSSLNATRAIAAIRSATSSSLPISELLGTKTLGEIAHGLEQDRPEAPFFHIPLKRRSPELTIFPASYSQERVWFIRRMTPSNLAYHTSTKIRFIGEFDKIALEKTLSRIVARHEIFRTTFSEIEGSLFQAIHDPWKVELEEIDVMGNQDAVEEILHGLQYSFDLGSLPLVRWKLVRVHDHEHVLLMIEHHVIHDGWSLNVFFKELVEFYRSYAAGRDAGPGIPPFQFGDFSQWQREWMAGRQAQEQLEYWAKTLKDCPPLLLSPSGRPRPPHQQYKGGALVLPLSNSLDSELHIAARRYHATLFTLFAAAFEILLYKYSGQEDFCIGLAIANRTQVQSHSIIGMMVNNIPLRSCINDDLTLGELLQMVKETSFKAYEHQDVPFEKIVQVANPARDPSYHPVFQVMLSFNDSPVECERLSGTDLIIEDTFSNGSAKFDLNVILLLPQTHNLPPNYTPCKKLLWEYNSDVFDRSMAQQMAQHFLSILQELPGDMNRRISEISWLRHSGEQQFLYEWSNTVEFPREKCAHQLFEEQVSRTPEAMAVVFEKHNLTYAELNQRANRLAHYLIALGVRPDHRVALCAERSLEMMVGLIGVLKAGGAYVPLDPGYPEERLQYMLEDSGAVVLLTQSHLLGHFAKPVIGIPVVELDKKTQLGNNNNKNDGRNLLPQALGLTCDHLVYVIYTSGSTGTPKGVMVSHRGLCNYLHWAMQEYTASQVGSTVSSSFSFDGTVTSIYLPLLCGGQVRLLSEQDALQSLYNELRSGHEDGEGKKLYKITPSHLDVLSERLLREGARTAVGEFIIGGEKLSGSTVERWRQIQPGMRMINEYGPTETVVGCSRYVVQEEWRGTGESVPIGQPIANTQIYILDGNGELVPRGVVGELYIAGAGVARGYLNRPALTAEKFVPNPYAPEMGARMYRTGDLGRWLANGNIQFLGRNDFQVKVRGFRIELGEIEAKLAECMGVRQAVVMAREDEKGEKRLVAYVVAADAMAGTDAVNLAGKLHAYLTGILPKHMVPAAYVRMEMLPLTSNGKVDRKALPEPEEGAFAKLEYEAPRGEIENVLAGIWTDVLNLERIGRQDNFFHLGGHSLLVMRVSARLRQALGMEVPIRDLFAQPVLADLARFLESVAHKALPAITKTNHGNYIPLSLAQQRLWFLAQMEDVREAYQVPFGWLCKGELNYIALRQALDRILLRHETLRSTFIFHDEQPVQRITAGDNIHFCLLEHDLREHPDREMELQRLIAEESATPFDLEAGPPIRGRIIQLDEAEHALLLTMHHIVSDGWSMGVLLKELKLLYGTYMRGEDDPLAPLPIQYGDYAVWQRRWMEGEKLREQEEYWKNALRGAPQLLELPLDRPRPAQQDLSGGTVELVLEERLTSRLKELSQRHGATLYMTLLAGWAALLGRLSGQNEVVIGSPVANRGRSEIEGLIGCFVNTLALRVDLSQSPTVGDLLQQVKKTTIEAQQHQDIPFEQVVELLQPVRSLAHAPVFQVMFTWESKAEEKLELAGLQPQPLARALFPLLAKFDLRLALEDSHERLTGWMEYATALFDKATIKRHAGYLMTMLRGMAEDQKQEVAGIDLLEGEERKLLLEEWNATEAEYPEHACIHELFEEQVRRTPEATALVYEEQSLSYEELNRQANQLAHYLIGLGVKPDERVGICVERGVGMVVGLLGILKAGGAYVPLDPAYPCERLREIVEDAGPRMVLSDAAGREALGEESLEGKRNVSLDLVGQKTAEGRGGEWGLEWAEQARTNPGTKRLGLSSKNLAYVIYTSGSTGRPKGVMVEHGSVVNFLCSMAEKPGITCEDRLLAVTSISFDIAGLELYLPLSKGAQIVLASRDDAVDPYALHRSLVAYGITMMQATPATWRGLLDANWNKSLELVVLCGGEALPDDLASRLSDQGGAVWNMYGPTETTIWSSCARVLCAEDNFCRPSIGRPIANTKMYLLDGKQRPVPLGAVGEIYIGGAGVARGYLNRPELTEERFLKDPFTRDREGRMYKTGDLGRYLGDGNIEFLGRNDQQVKIRGFRIELGEIEARMAQHEAVQDVVVVAREDATGDKRLVAYYTEVERASQTVGPELLRTYLATKLPEYMVPAAYVRLKALPLNANGKLDRKALPEPEADAYLVRRYEAPAGYMETALAAIWADVLKLERVGRYDNFFELGGHSLMVMRVIARLRQSLGVETQVRELFAQPVLADLARTLERAARNALPPITRRQAHVVH